MGNRKHKHKSWNNLSDFSKPQSSTNGMQVTRQEFYSGPIPHPSIVEKWEQLHPGAAEIILKMADRQAEHRQNLERKVIDSDVKKSERGQVFGLIVATGGLLIGGYVALQGYELAGGIIGGVDLVALVGVFVYGRYQKGAEIKGRRE